RTLTGSRTGRRRPAVAIVAGPARLLAPRAAGSVPPNRGARVGSWPGPLWGGRHGSTPIRGRLGGRRAPGRARLRRGRLPDARNHADQSVSTWRRRRRGRQAVCRRDGTPGEAAGGDRDQGGRRRPGGRTIRRQRQAGRLYAAGPYRLDLRL